MYRGFTGNLVFVPVLIVVMVAVCASGTKADINLQWRPANQTVVVGDLVDMGLFAVSDDGTDQPLGFVIVVLGWDPSPLELVGVLPELDEYSWLRSFFPDDRDLDAINNDCSVDSFCDPFTGALFNDGTAYYEAWRAFPPAAPPIATPAGSLVTTFRFKALRSGFANIRFIPQAGKTTITRVLSASDAAVEITGTLGPDAQIFIGTCTDPATIEAEGARYLAVTPPPGVAPVALLLTGGDSGDAACLSSYIGADGSLVGEPEFLTPEDWETVHVSDASIVPLTEYQVQVDCGTVLASEFSHSASAITWAWGDVDGNGVADDADVSLVLAASLSSPDDETIYHLDLAGCTPNGMIDTDDVITVLAASQGAAFPCPLPCSISVSLADLNGFVVCLNGPGAPVSSECVDHDLDDDDNVDIRDFAVFQNSMVGVNGGP